jgi:hypothetical protein
MLGNVYQDSLETIWSQGEKYYAEHCRQAPLAGNADADARVPVYPGICATCDEYYTYNF